MYRWTVCVSSAQMLFWEFIILPKAWKSTCKHVSNGSNKMFLHPHINHHLLSELVHTWYSSLAHLRQRLCRQGRMTTGFVKTSTQMGQMSCFSSVPNEGSLWEERISSGRDMALCPRWPHTHWKLSYESENTAREMRHHRLHVSVLCGCLIAQSSSQSLCPCVGLQLDICVCSCERGGRCLVSCWLTGTPPTLDQLCLYQTARGMLGNRDDASSPVTPNHSCLQSQNSQQVNNARTATALQESKMFMKCTRNL